MITVVKTSRPIVVNRGTGITVQRTTRRLVVDRSGPQGPRGFSASDQGGGATLAEVNAIVGLHIIDPTPHPNATSGRDYAALFENGIT